MFKLFLFESSVVHRIAPVVMMVSKVRMKYIACFKENTARSWWLQRCSAAFRIGKCRRKSLYVEDNQSPWINDGYRGAYAELGEISVVGVLRDKLSPTRMKYF